MGGFTDEEDEGFEVKSWRRRASFKIWYESGN